MSGATDRFRRGQAMVELLLGIVAVIIIVSALSGFVYYIVDSLAVQNSVRSRHRRVSSDVHANISIGDYTIRKLHIHEPVGGTDRRIQ